MIPPSDKNKPLVLRADVKQPATAAASPNCPRCDSPNTKFCYYNNYSLAQPRHFCKSCKRYWTKGGALRNVPVGGACRKKNKITNSSTNKSCFSRNIINVSLDHSIQHEFSSSSTSGLKFFQGMDFHQVGAGTGTGGINLPIINSNSFNPLSSSSSSNNLNVETAMGGFGMYQDMGSSLSCIESLSSINQELHWKLQQQRLMGVGGIYSIGENHNNNYQKQALQPPINYVLMENLNKSLAETESSKSRMNGNLQGTAETWYLDNCYEGASTSSHHDQKNPRNINNIDDYQNINGGGSVQARRSHFRHPHNIA